MGVLLGFSGVCSLRRTQSHAHEEPAALIWIRRHLLNCHARQVELFLLAALLGYFILSRNLPHVPLCPFAWFGVPCPTCGTTRSLWQICHGNLRMAWSLNPIGFVVFFLLVRRFAVLSLPPNALLKLAASPVTDRLLLAAFFLFGFMKFFHAAV